jgi:hypothetical protein
MQIHKLGHDFSGPDLTKMFHVKLFCPIGAKNLTRAKTVALL